MVIIFLPAPSANIALEAGIKTLMASFTHYLTIFMLISTAVAE